MARTIDCVFCEPFFGVPGPLLSQLPRATGPKLAGVNITPRCRDARPGLSGRRVCGRHAVEARRPNSATAEPWLDRLSLPRLSLPEACRPPGVPAPRCLLRLKPPRRLGAEASATRFSPRIGPRPAVDSSFSRPRPPTSSYFAPDRWRFRVPRGRFRAPRWMSVEAP